MPVHHIIGHTKFVLVQNKHIRPYVLYSNIVKQQHTPLETIYRILYFYIQHALSLSIDRNKLYIQIWVNNGHQLGQTSL